MNFNSLDDILKYAIEKEKEAVEFYEDLASQEAFAGVRDKFKDFANEERKHQNLLENLSNNQATVQEYDFKWIPDMKRSDYMVDIEYQPGMTFPDIIRLAMKREEKALKLYNEMAKNAEGIEQLNVFKILCQEEAKHKMVLETIYDDFMAEQGD